MKRKLIYAIICCLVIVLLVIGLVFIIKSDNLLEPPIDSIQSAPYTVTFKDSDGFEIEAISYNGYNELALFITSFEDYSSVDVEITYFDSDNQILNTSVITNNFVAKQKQFVISTGVEATTVKVIEVKIIPAVLSEYEESSITSPLDSSMLDFQVFTDLDDDNNLAITLKTNNPYGQIINLVSGYVLLYNDDYLVDTVPFSAINFEQGGQISIDVSTRLHDTTGIFKYDDIKVIVNELY